MLCFGWYDWLIDWLIDDCLTSSDQYLSYILDENKFYNIINPDRKGGDMCQTGASAFHCHREYMEIWTKMTQLVFFSFRQRGLYRAGIVVLSRHVTQYGPRSQASRIITCTTLLRNERASSIRYVGSHLAILKVWVLTTVTSTQWLVYN